MKANVRTNAEIKNFVQNVHVEDYQYVGAIEEFDGSFTLEVMDKLNKKYLPVEATYGSTVKSLHNDTVYARLAKAEREYCNRSAVRKINKDLKDGYAIDIKNAGDSYFVDIKYTGEPSTITSKILREKFIELSCHQLIK